MSAQNVEIIRTLLTYWNTRELGRSFDLLADDVELEVPYPMPGLQGVRRGHDAIRAFWREWLSAWEVITVREIELHDAYDEVLAVWTQDMRGRGGDVAMETRQAGIFTLRDGKVTRVLYYADPSQAEAAFAR